jgi:outer membrane protein TolC
MDHANAAAAFRWNIRRRMSILALALASALGVRDARSSALEASGENPVEKVRATMQAVLAEAPLSAVQLSQLAAEVAALRSATGSGAPVLSWQSEGIGGGFQRNLNAADYLRLSKPFNRPWHRDTIRELRDASERWLESGQQVTTLELASLAGRSWLDLAAAIAREELAAVRVARLDRALTIQQKRFELGEISGSERRQIELERARELATLDQLEASRLAVQRELEILAPGGFPSPAGQDLEALVEATTPIAGDSDSQTVLAGPALQFVASKAEMAQLEAERQRGAAWGLPEIEVEWERIPDLGVVEGFDSFGFYLAIPLPVGKQGHQRIAAAEQSAIAAAAEHDLMQQRLAARFQTAIETAKGAEAALAALEPAIADASAIERSLSEQFRLGAISYLIYLDGFARLDTVIQGVIEARHALLSARLELAVVSGAETYFPLPELETGGGS